MADKDPTLFDTRVIQHHLRRGSLTAEQLAEHLANLPDEAEHGEPTTTQFVPRAASAEARKAAQRAER